MESWLFSFFLQIRIRIKTRIIVKGFEGRLACRRRDYVHRQTGERRKKKSVTGVKKPRNTVYGTLRLSNLIQEKQWLTDTFTREAESLSLSLTPREQTICQYYLRAERRPCSLFFVLDQNQKRNCTSPLSLVCHTLRCPRQRQRIQ